MARSRQIIEKLFFERYTENCDEIPFKRSDLFEVCEKHNIQPLANMGDGVIYSYRYRQPLPASILDTQPEGMEWAIFGRGNALYAFKLVRATRIAPSESLVTINIPDSTPEIITAHALSDEQALLAKIRYNRLIDIFLGIPTYSLQNHLRTKVKHIGQIEIDELYAGIDSRGCHYIIPVQAKGEKDQIGVVQITQDLAYVDYKFPGIKCRAIAAQFMSDEVVALFELTLQDEEIKIVEERHYRLVAHEELDSDAIRNYRD